MLLRPHDLSLGEKKPLPKPLCVKVLDELAWGVIQAFVVRVWWQTA